MTTPAEIGLITVIPEELRWARSVLEASAEERSPIGTVFLRGSLHSSKCNRPYTYALCALGSAGNYESAAAVTEIIDRYHPQVIFLIGIAAGLRDKIQIGAVVLSERVVAYESAELRVKGKAPTVIPRPGGGPVSYAIQQDLVHYLSSVDIDSRLQEDFLSAGGQFPAPQKPEDVEEYRKHVATRLSVHTATVASGEKLLKDPGKLRTYRDDLHGRIEVGEMEAAGLEAACRRANRPWLVVRGVSDFGDQLKSDEFHRFASLAAAVAVRDFIRHGLVLPQTGASGARTPPPRDEAVASSGRGEDGVQIRELLPLPKRGATQEGAPRAVPPPFLRKLGLILTSSSTRPIAETKWRAPRLLDTIADGAERLMNKAGRELGYRHKLLRRLLRMSGDLTILSNRQHPRYGEPGPHDFAAMAAAGALLESPIRVDRDYMEPDIEQDGVFMPGSPVSSGLATSFIPVTGPQLPHADQVPLVVNPEAVPYHFRNGSSRCLRIKSATRPGETRDVRNNGLVHDGESWFPTPLASSGGWLATDFLLLSVFPRNFGGGHVVLAGGGHGAGTSALSLLLDPAAVPLSQLEDIVASVEGFPYYQLVLEVPVSSDGLFTRGKSLRLSTELRPVGVVGPERLLSLPPSEIRNALFFGVGQRVPGEIQELDGASSR